MTAIRKLIARRQAETALIALAVIWTITMSFDPWSGRGDPGDVGVFQAFAARFGDGMLPYRDVPFEYPPLAAPVVALPGVLASETEAFRLALGLSMLPWAMALAALVRRLAAATSGNGGWALAGVCAAPLLTGAVVWLHFDFVPAVLTVAALLALVRERPVLCMLLLGLGGMVKLFPLVAAPMALAWLLGRGRRDLALRGLGALCAIVLAFVAVAVALSPDGALDSLRFQTDRPIQIESLPATIVFALDEAGGPVATTVFSNNSIGLVSTAADAAELGSLVALVLVLALLLALSHRAGRAEEPDTRGVVLAALAAVAAVATFGKVLSPQFLVWVTPLLALALAWRQWALAACVAVAQALTLAEFPGRYLDLVELEDLPRAIVAARNLALLAILIVVVRALLGRPGRPATSPA